MGTIYAIAPAITNVGLIPHRAYEVRAEDNLGGFVIITEHGHEAQCLWRGCAHLFGGDWTRAEAKPLGDR
jgi:hypothetical protein